VTTRSGGLLFVAVVACASLEANPDDADATTTGSSSGSSSSSTDLPPASTSGDASTSMAPLADDSTSDSGSSTTSPVDPPQRPPEFVDVTIEAGLDLHPGSLVGAPVCALDDLNAPDQTGDYCIPEAYLGAAAAGDYDLDGDLDLYLTRRDGPDRLLANQGDGTFTVIDAGIDVPEPGSSAAWLDVDADGDLDLMVTVLGAPHHHLFINAGDGTFADEAIARGVAMDGAHPLVGTGIGAGDYDRDGYLDLFLGEWRPDKHLGAFGGHNRLLHNLGAASPGVYEDVTDAFGIDLAGLAPIVDAKDGEYGFAPAFVDFDDDGWPDLALTGDFGTSRLWFNEQGLAFTDVTWDAGVGTERNGMGSTFGDYDGDGDLDWFVSAIWTDEAPWLGHRLYRNEGTRQFTDVTDVYGLRDAGWGWGAAWLDRDHDGDLDLAMAAGWPYLGYDADPFRLWDNDGLVGPWPERATELGIDYPAAGRGVLPFDYDGDGDLDLLITGVGREPALYRNDGAAGDWLQVRAAGVAGDLFGVGVKVAVQVTEAGPVQVRHILGDTQLFGQPPPMAHFGLGEGDEPIASVSVTWPVTGETIVYPDVPRNDVLVVSP
jgi:hypothetical protein